MINNFNNKVYFPKWVLVAFLHLFNSLGSNCTSWQQSSQLNSSDINAILLVGGGEAIQQRVEDNR